ncbi:hypothetical protein Acr_05g0009950 [Actinidia rufa]|uniref:Uncharacterized protein n=1 Tax=Actinidia rufa TaxID=165716 RepID=A0A7J0EMG7_9ERIC|nr:hypothetical protein Acr_05g0009950 [Actinidia rufa]
MSKRLKLSDLAKVVAQKAATSASKGVVISEGSETTSGKRALDDGSKGKQVAQPPESKKAKTDTGASEAPARLPIASGEGSSIRRTLGEALGPQASVMASAVTAEKILAGVILPADKEKVDRLTFDQVVTKFIHAIGQGVILGSSLAVRSRDLSESALNQKAVAESVEMEMVRAQNRAIELEGALPRRRQRGRSSPRMPMPETRSSRGWRRGSPSWKEASLSRKDVEMDHELLAKEEAEAEKKATEEGAAGAEGVERQSQRTCSRSHVDRKLNAEWVASAGKWFNGGNGGFYFSEIGTSRNLGHWARSITALSCMYINGVNLFICTFPLLSKCCSVSELHLTVNRLTVPFMFSKTNLGGEESEQSLPSWISDHLGAKSYIDETSQSPLFPPIPPNSPEMDTSSLTKEGNVMSQSELDKLGSTYSFPSGLRLRILGDGETILSARQGKVAFYKAAFLAGLRLPIYPTIREILCLYSLSPLPDSGWYYFKARPEKNLFRGSPSNVKGWKTRFFFASGDEWEFPPGVAASDTPRVPRSWGTPGKSCNKLPTLTEVDAERTEAIFGKIKPGGYFEVSKVLGSRIFRKYFAVGCTALFTSGGDNTTSGDEGEFVTCEDSVEYLGVIRRGIGGAIRRALPGIPDETLLRWLGGKVKDPFTNILSGESGSAMSARAGAPALGEKTGGKAKAEKATTATTAKPPTKGVVIREKRMREGVPVIEIGEPDSSKGKEAAPPPPPKRFKSNLGAINAKGRAAEAETSSPGGEVGSESMSDASVARRLLTGVIPASDKKEVDQLSENELVAKSFHALGQVVVFASSLALRSQEHLHDIDFHMARADSAELELVKAQKRAVKAENWLAELSEERSKPGTEVDDLKATVAELTNKLAKAKELAIEDFKASGEFKAAVTDSAATYFSDGFEFCKRQLLHQFPNLGVDVANMAMDPSFAEEEEAIQGGEDPVVGIAPNV